MILKVIQNKLKGNNYFSLILEKPEGFDFYPGQYLDVKLTNDSRAFTISSSPTEGLLMITSKIGRTSFKKFMQKLKKGDVITASHPVGTFILDESTPAVFIAGGIGITPFRSIIKYILDRKIPTTITLIYSASRDFAFKNELDKWQKQLPGLKIYYLDTSKEGRLSQKRLNTFGHSFIYYLAGSHGFVDNLEEILLKMGVDETNIRTDRFDGY